jgi:hypothetical protein
LLIEFPAKAKQISGEAIRPLIEVANGDSR